MARTPRAKPAGKPSEPAADTKLPDDGFGKNPIEQAAEIGELHVESLAVGIRDIVMEMFKHRPKPWAQMTADEQKDVAGHVEYAAKRMVRRAVGLIAAIDRPGVLCKLNSYGEADGVKVQLSLAAMDPQAMGQAILLLHANVRKEVMLVSADADGLFGSAAAKVDDDQKALSFESDADRPATGPLRGQAAPPADDSDLNPGGDQAPAIVDQVSAAATADEGDPNFGVFDAEAGEKGMWLEGDKQFWTVDPAAAGRWSQVRATQIAGEQEGSEAQRLD